MLEFVGEIRDPIHGLIPLTEIEFRVVDTRPLQRLRGIKQLALAHLGFPGAQHTRFEHSIGVMHVAGKIIEHLLSRREIKELSEEEIQNIRLAALLHDVGHGPFSHVSEYILKECYSGDIDNIETIHEDITRGIITSNKELTEILGEQRAQDIVSLLKNDAGKDFRNDIVSGPLDADKMDYLLRDSYFCGVKYGIFDIERLINVLTLVDENEFKRLAIKVEGIETAVQYVLAKYFITEQVYEHRIRYITDLMLVEGVLKFIGKKQTELKQLYSFDTSNAYYDLYLRYDDRKVIDSILDSHDTSNLGYRYFDKLRKRDLLKELYTGKVKELVPESKEMMEKLQALKSGDVAELQERLCSEADLMPEFTHVKLHSFNDPLVQKPDPYFREELIKVKVSSKRTTVLERESVLFKNLLQEAANLRLSVLSYPTDNLLEEQRETLRNKIWNILRDYLEA
jgi:hypothetical protein